MTASIAALSRARHGTTTVGTGTDLEAAARFGHVPLGLGEVALAACDYPLVLIKDGATGAFRLVALFGFEADRNLYILGENWAATYLPLNVLRLPFCLAAPQGQALEVCIDEASSLVGQTTGTALFAPDGSESAFLTGRRALLARMADDMEAATRFVATLAAERLVTLMTITLHFADQHQQDITGTYTIDPLALDALDDAAVLRLRRSGLLAPIHAMIHSLGQINRLEQLHNAQTARRIARSAVQLHL